MGAYSLYFSQIKVLIDEEVYSEHGKLIRCDIGPGSVKKCILA
jgi:hypothetical protein